MNKKITAAALIAFFAIGAHQGFIKKYNTEIKKIPLTIYHEYTERSQPYIKYKLLAGKELNKQGVKLVSIGEDTYTIQIEKKQFTLHTIYDKGKIRLLDPHEYY